MNQAIIDSKKAVVFEIAQKMKESQSTVVVEYRGLSVAEVTELRRNLREEGVEFRVYKNPLAQRAAVETGADGPTKNLIGPNAITFGGDAVAPARVLTKFAKKHEYLVLKSEIIEGKVVGVDIIKELFSLSNREGMLSMLLSCLQSPAHGFACAAKAVANAKDGGSAEEAAPQEQIYRRKMKMVKLVQGDILAYLEEATILELNELVKTIEEKFGVTTAAPVVVAAIADDAAAAGPSGVTVTLTDIGGTKVTVVKATREITGLGLADAKGLVDKAPSVIKESIRPEEAEEIKKELMDAGASVEIK